MKKVLMMAAMVAATMVGGEVRAGIILSDNFTYQDGPLVGAAGSPWLTNSGTAGQQNVVSGELFLNDNETEDTRANFSDVTSSITASFDFRFDSSDVPTGTGNYFLHFIGDTDSLGAPNDFIGRVFVKDPGTAGTGRFAIGVGNSTGTGSSAVYLGTDLLAGTNYSALLSYDFVNKSTSLTVTGIGTATATDTAANITRLTAFGFRQSTNHGDVFIDNLVVTAVPEPTAMLLVGSLVGLIGFKRRR
jgi:hypothetical protein